MLCTALLIVDGDEDVCESIRYLVDWHQYDVSSVLTVSSYGEAVNSIMDFLPHIALVDVELGEYWGYELAEHFWNAGVKTIFCMMSSREDFQYVRKSMRAGARDFLLKPINTKELQDFLERTIVRDLNGTIPERTLSRPEVDPVLQVEYSQLNNFYVHFKNYYHISPSALRRFDEGEAPPPLPTGPGMEDAEALAEETSKLSQ